MEFHKLKYFDPEIQISKFSIAGIQIIEIQIAKSQISAKGEIACFHREK